MSRLLCKALSIRRVRAGSVKNVDQGISPMLVVSLAPVNVPGVCREAGEKKKKKDLQLLKAIARNTKRYVIFLNIRNAAEGGFEL